MPRYNPRTHVFGYGGTTPKVKRERFALDEFCKRMRSHHCASYRVVLMSDALRRGLVKEVEGSTVDGVIRTSRGMVAVELAGYSPHADRGDVMALDLAFRKVVKRSLFDCLKTKCYSLRLDYRERRRRGPKYAVVRTVPQQGDFKAVVKELRSIVSDAPALDLHSFLSIQFVNAELATRWGKRRGTLYLDEARFPACALHFDRVSLQGLREYLTPEVNSELDGGYVGIDSVWVREHAASKAAKSLRWSRERANGLPLWLIVHSDGHATHQVIQETQRPRALELCREALAATEHGFSRVYWADRTGWLNAAWVGRVI